MKTVNPLGRDFTFLQLMAYTAPAVCMMIFMSTYTVIDGIFVANLVGEDALAAVNIVFPLLMVIMAVGLMFATGGNAVIAKLLGEGKEEEARGFLTMLYIIGGILGFLSTILVFSFPVEILNALNITENLYDYGKSYLLSLAIFAVPVIYMMFAQSFLVTAGSPTLGFLMCFVGGISNIILDYVLISPNLGNLGIVGAGIATGFGNAIPGVLGFFYFLFHRKGYLYFTKPSCDWGVLGQSIYNGISELINTLAVSITTVMFNVILLNLVGETGVVAITVILYIQMFQNGLYMGFALGISPIIAYKFGEENWVGLKKVIKQSFQFTAVASLFVVMLTLLLQDLAVGIFIQESSVTYNMTKDGLVLFAPAYLFMGFNIFISAMFTSLSNGKVSATISVLRSLVFLVASLILLPSLFHLKGVWLAVPLAEAMACVVSFYFFHKNKKKYAY